MSTLEERVQALEDTAQNARAESSVPPGGLKVLPSGQVVYEFEGKIIASGILLHEELGEKSVNAIQWLTPSGLVREEIIGYGDVEDFHHIAIRAGTGNDQLYLNSQEKPKMASQLVAQLGGTLTMIMNSAGGSKFLQNINGEEQITLNFGEGQVTFGGASELSNTNEIEHKLGKVPRSIIVMRAELTSVKGTNSIITWGVQATSATKFKVNGNLPTGSIPVAGSIVRFFWIAIG